MAVKKNKIERGGAKRFWSAFLVLSFLGVLTRRAGADPRTRTESPATVAAPTLLASDLPYPQGAHGNATVTLVITVNADGSVRQARASDGDEPFASAAARAALFFRFEPARRGNVAIASVIRLEATFTDPAPVEQTSPLGSAEQPPGSGRPSAPLPVAPVAPRVVEVTVNGERPAPSVSTFTRAEVRQLPGAFGDPFRAIEAMPGVTPMISGLPFFYVRGAPPGNVGYFIDGVRVPYLYHVALGPSVIHPGMVDHVDLYPGGYPARYGRFAGGIVAGETTPPRTDFHGEANLRVFDVGALVETGFASDKGTALIGGRYSYTGGVVSLLAPGTVLDYRDYEARVSYDLTPKDRVSVFSFGSYDLLGQKSNDFLRVAFGAEFYRVDVRYDHALDGGGNLRTAVTLGVDRTLAAETIDVQDRMIGVRSELRRPLSDSALLRAGVDATADAYDANIVHTQQSFGDTGSTEIASLSAAFTPRTDVALGTYADVVFHFGPRIEVTPGLRVDFFGSGGATAVGIDPRLSARLAVTDHFRLIHAYGVSHQPPSFVAPVPGLTPANLDGGLQRTVSGSAGMEGDLAEDTTASLTFFESLFFNMSDALGTVSPNDNNLANAALTQRSTGTSIGMEVFIRRKLTRRIGGFVSYTLSRSMRALDGQLFPSTFDRTHVGNIALAYDLGRNWRAGTRLMFYTGAPAQPGFLRDGTLSQTNVTPDRLTSPDRDPPFYRVDLRLEKRWLIGRTGWLSFVAEVMNATLQKEIFNGETFGPVTIPSIGFEAGF